MALNLKKESESSLKQETPAEFTERVCRFLLVFTEGLSRLAGKDHALHQKLRELNKVVQKVARSKPSSELVREIDDYFSRLHLEKEFQKTEKEEVKQIVVQLTEALQELIDSTGGMDADLTDSIEKVQAADTIQDILVLKDEIVGHVKNVKEQTNDFRKQLQKQKQIALDLAEKVDQLKAGSLVDSLTNVFNRAAYTMKMSQALKEFERYKDPLALIVLDIDHFKKFNDQYGHKVGDKVLQSVASSIKGAVRGSDQVFRYGGEEFVILLHKIKEENAVALAKKIRAGVAKDYYIDADKEMKVTVSLGVAAAREGDVESTLFERADQAMYAAKKNGRNRVEKAS